MQQQRSRFAGVLSLATALLIGGGAVANAQDWDFAGGDFHNQRNAAGEDTINPRNVHNLGLKWSIVTHGDVSATPTVEVQGRKTTVYAVDWGGYLYSIDGNTGSINWSFPLSTYTGYAGSVSRTSPAIIGRNLIIGDQGSVDFNGAPDMNAGAPTASVMAIDKQTGALIWRSIVSTHPFSVITSSPVADGARVYVGVASLEENAGFIPGYPGYSFRGSVVALDLHTGSQIWSYTTIPTSLAGYTGASVWGSNPVIDLNRQSLYVGTGNNYSTPAGLTTPHPVNPPEDHFDSILALDLHTGNLKWATRMQSWDTWDVFSWEVLHAPNLGPDYDFGSAPNLYTVHMHGKPVEILGAGEKSGKYWALNPDDGSIRWSTQVGPGGTGGGIEWGSAVDGQRVYCAVSNSDSHPTGLGGSAGLWAGLDAATGNILWQTEDPLGGHDFGMVTIANGVVFAGSAGQTPKEAPPSGKPGGFFALDAATGNILWSYPLPSDSVNCGASVVNGIVYWGSGYSHLYNGFGISGTPQLFAFSLGGH
jgi:polyvinyl alcohol dehydrogenase (cytochrome)